MRSSLPMTRSATAARRPSSPRQSFPTHRSRSSSVANSQSDQDRRYGCTMPEPLRVVIGEDDVLLREGIARLLTDADFEVVAQASDAPDLLRKALAHRPSVVIADVNMPPGHADDGLRAAIEVRRQRPGTGVLVLSQYYEEGYALDLIGDRAEGVGYLLKERVGDLESFI